MINKQIIMEYVQQVTNHLTEFISHKDFFYYHGVVLAFLWFIAATVGILLRRVSLQLHALVFFLVDFITAFFIIGAILRVYPYLSRYESWSIVKKCHIIGGAVFLVLLVIQHAGGVTSFLKGVRSNPAHRKFGVVVSGLGKFLAVGGMIIAGWSQQIVIASAVLAVLMTAFGFYKHFIVRQTPTRENKSASSENVSQTSRQRSPPREVKRD